MKSFKEYCLTEETRKANINAVMSRLEKINQKYVGIEDEFGDVVKPISKEDLNRLKKNIEERYIDDGWTEDEIVDFFKWTEDINPVMSEERAFKAMKQVSDSVAKRLGRKLRVQGGF